MTKDEIILQLFDLLEGLSCQGVLTDEECDQYDKLVGEYERICVKEEM